MAKKSELKVKIHNLELDIRDWRQWYKNWKKKCAMDQERASVALPEKSFLAFAAMARKAEEASKELSLFKNAVNDIDVYLQNLAKDNPLIFKTDKMPRLKGIIDVGEALTLAKRTWHGLEVAGKQKDGVIRSLEARNLKLRKSLADLSQRYQSLKSECARAKESTASRSTRPKNPYIRPKFVECPTCAAIPGMPTLCRECVERRELFEEREKESDFPDSMVSQVSEVCKAATPRDGRKTRFA